jgi:hypothetical protein
MLMSWGKRTEPNESTPEAITAVHAASLSSSVSGSGLHHRVGFGAGALIR